MGLSAGARLGPYEILSAVGAGGMGEVYRARDTRLERTVAIKVLNSALVASPDVKARFEREAKTVSQLNHPNICVLHDIGHDADIDYLVMEFIEGESLSDRLRRGPIPWKEVVSIAGDIAEALDRAHRAGVVHRDLKPGNVMLTKTGAKLLDFGLAKPVVMSAAAGSGSAPLLSAAMTMTSPSPQASPLTQQGALVGTVQYMSPEQIQGVEADARSDIFAFGAVLYEMTTGKRPFEGKSQIKVASAILEDEPQAVSAIAQTAPAALARVIRTCLAKEPDRRYQCARDLKLQFEMLAEADTQSPTTPIAATPSSPRWAIPLLFVVVAMSLLTAAGLWFTRKNPPSPVVARFAIPLPHSTEFVSTARNMIAISPDGKTIAYTAGSPVMLYVRTLSDTTIHPVAGSNDGVPYNPVFSPDGRSLVYWTTADRAIKRISIEGGVPVQLCKSAIPLGISWSNDDIVYSTGEQIDRVSSNGGTPEHLITVGNGEVAFGPQLLPNGRDVLYTLSANGGAAGWDQGKVVVQSASGARKTIAENAADGRYVADGHIVFARGGVLFAVPFNSQRLEVTGKEVPVLEGVRRSSITMIGSAANFGVSNTGTMVYIPGPVAISAEQMSMVTYELSGTSQILDIPPGPYRKLHISPDGRHIAFESNDGNDADIWVWDLGGKAAPRRLTFSGHNHSPAWSADSTHVLFESDREGNTAIFWQRQDGTGTPERLVSGAKELEFQPLAWAPHGDGFLYDNTATGRTTLWYFSMKDHKATQLSGIDSSAAVTGAEFSPDGKWIAYASRGDGTHSTLYVEPFPQTGAKYQVSSALEDGHHPIWTPDGKGLFYVPGPGTHLIRVPVVTAPTFSFGAPEGLDMPYYNSAPTVERSFDLMPDGKHILSLREALDKEGRVITPEIDVVLNWFEELKSRAPVTQ